NSLTWEARITPPAPVDPEKTVFRVHLRDYGWKEHAWDLLADAYPYPVQGNSADAEYCRSATGCRLPALRRDRFARAASRPPLYPALLKLPSAEWEIRDRLQVGWSNVDPFPPKVFRAGFTNSGISRNNRVLERWNALHGAFWRTFDFTANTGEQDV